MTEYKDAVDRYEMMKSEDKIRIAFGEMGKDDAACNQAYYMMMGDNLPLSAGLLVALEHIMKERDKLRDIVLEYHCSAPPKPILIKSDGTL